MEGSVEEVLKRLVTDFNVHTMYALFGSIGMLSALLFFRWVYNKRKFNKLSHEIPASVVKNYLDSIIQNSNSLKSSLFRGDLGTGEGAPAVMPVGDLGSGVSSGVSQEEFNQKVSEIAVLKGKLSEKEALVKELEAKVATTGSSVGADIPVDDGAKDAEIATLKEEIEKLKAQLSDAQASTSGESGGDEELSAKLADVTKERDELKERLQEYEIIEDDLANLKRLQQENAELRAALEGKGGAPAPTAEAPAEPAAAKEPEPIEEVSGDDDASTKKEVEPSKEPEPIEEASGDKAPAKEPEPIEEAQGEGEASSDDDPELKGEEKSAEDLLSEFEKMLG